MTAPRPPEAPSGQIALLESARGLPPSPARFAKVFTRAATRNASFRDETVPLHGRAFVNCHFENCTLDASSADYDLIGCTLDARTTITCRAPVAEILAWVSPGFPWANQNLPAFFVPLRRENGAITLWFLGKFI